MASRADMKKRFRIVGQGELEASRAQARQEYDLATLQDMSASELSFAYRRAAPASALNMLDGERKGTLLTLVGPLSRGRAKRLTRKIAASSRFPGLGKTFQSWASERGSGINRVRFLGERLWFHFETRIDASELDQAPCVVLDYSQADKPWPLRQVRDELRQVGPDLWLGVGTVRSHVVLYFAITTA